ncbi:MAG: FecR domain-containing protein [Alphaproteobacteria bacterium]|nr:FecR domain-containing protein [Alphaproteobacteria bacterium]MCB9985921.1 FecR domain-containing protein [Micavibrio sp.]
MSEVNGSPVGLVAEINGLAHVSHPDGTQETMSKGQPVFQGDIIETDEAGAVNITFNDGTVFAVSNDAKMTIDEFVYDPDKDGEGQADVSVVRGVFLYTSGFVGKEDHNDVHIKTPVGSIGIRGTTLTGFIPEAGDTEAPRISLIEGAIMVTPNQGDSILLDESRETVVLNFSGTEAHNIGVIDAESMIQSYNVVRSVAPELFSPVSDALGHPTSGEVVDPDHGAHGEDSNPEQHSQSSLPEDATSTGSPGEEDSSQQAQDDAAATADGLPSDSGDNLPVEETLLDSQPSIFPDDGLIPLMPMENHPLLNFLKPPSLLTGTNDTGLLNTADGFPAGSAGTDTLFFVSDNHAPIAHQSQHTFLEQSLLEGTTQRYNLSSFFSDPDGDALTYKISGTQPQGTNLFSALWFNANNELFVKASSNLSADATGKIFIQATDGLSVSQTVEFSFNIIDSSVPSLTFTSGNDTPSPLGGAGGERFSMLAGNDTLTISSSSSNNHVFSGFGDDTVTVNSSNNKIYGEAGNDTLYIAAGSTSGNTISGGDGNDNLSVYSSLGGNTVFGGSGRDTITLNNFATSKLIANDLLIDAGSGYDTLLLDNVSSIDLSAIDASHLHSIEHIKSISSTTAVYLNIHDIVEHSDTGFIVIDNVASVNVSSSAGFNNLVIKADNISNPFAVDAIIYDVYSNGSQTLYIEDGINLTGTGI